MAVETDHTKTLEGPHNNYVLLTQVRGQMQLGRD